MGEMQNYLPTLRCYDVWMIKADCLAPGARVVLCRKCYKALEALRALDISPREDVKESECCYFCGAEYDVYHKNHDTP